MMLIFPPLKRRTSKSEDDARWRRSPDEEYSSSSSSSSSLSSSSRSKSSSSESSSSSKRMYRYHHLYKVIDFITLFFCVGVAAFERSPPKRDLFRLKIFIRKSCAFCRPPTILILARIFVFDTRENKDANVTSVHSKCFPYTRNLFQRFLRSEIAERTLA